MTDREKVIKGLEAILEETADMFYRSTIQDAIALLKAQEPRILRLDELRGNDTAYIELNNLREPVLHCIIYYDKEADGMDVKPIKTNISSAYLRYSEHNRVWRPWTSQPSDAQREATAWDERKRRYQLDQPPGQERLAMGFGEIL